IIDGLGQPRCPLSQGSSLIQTHPRDVKLNDLKECRKHRSRIGYAVATFVGALQRLLLFLCAIPPPGQNRAERRLQTKFNEIALSRGWQYTRLSDRLAELGFRFGQC